MGRDVRAAVWTERPLEPKRVTALGTRLLETGVAVRTIEETAVHPSPAARTLLWFFDRL